MEKERYQRLITRDKMRSELIPMVGAEYRPEILTMPRDSFAGMYFESAPLPDAQIETRRYRLRRRIIAEIFEYEEF